MIENTGVTGWTPEALFEEQIRREQDMKDRGAGLYSKETGSGQRGTQSHLKDKAQERIVSEIFQAMKQSYEAIEGHYGQLINGELVHRFGKNIKALQLLREADPDIIASIASKSILESAYHGETVLEASLHAADLIQDQLRFNQIKESAPYILKGFQATFLKKHIKDYSYRRENLIKAEKLMLAGNDNFTPVGTKRTEWTKGEKIVVGAFLIELLREHVLFNGKPVIKVITQRTSKNGQDKTLNILALTEDAEEWVQGFKGYLLANSTTAAPCCIPPRDWTSGTDGGFYTEFSSKVPLIKTSTCQESQLRTLTYNQMPEVYDAVNHLQAVPWEVNTEILRMLEASLSSGVGLGMPSSEPLDIPPAPVPEEFKDARGAELFKLLKDDDRKRFLAWKREAADLYTEERRRVGKLKKIILSLKELRELERYPAFYYVHTVDSRGRIYPVSALISPQGSDISRASIRFHEAQALGEDGIYWLAIQGANTYSQVLSKSSFNDRYKKILELTDEILCIASDPFRYKSWAGAKAPWQFLAFCFEWKRLQDHIKAGEKAETFLSHLPVHLDATCSGIQHYSLMLRDAAVGRRVNLIQDYSDSIESSSASTTYGPDKYLKNPRYSMAPTDIYQEVANLTDLKLVELANNGYASITEPLGCTGYKDISAPVKSPENEPELLQMDNQFLYLDAISALDKLRSDAKKKLAGNGIHIEALIQEDRKMGKPQGMSVYKYNKLFKDKYGEYKPPKARPKREGGYDAHLKQVKEKQVSSKAKAPAMTAALKSKLASAWLSVDRGRKMTKPTVLTSVYGSTQLRCKDWIKEYLKSVKHEFTMQLSDEMNIWSAVGVCSKIVWSCTNEAIKSTKDAMKFISAVSKAVPTVTSALKWRTPTGFIVEQKALKCDTKRVVTHLLGTIDVTYLLDTDKVDLRRTHQSVAPNFIQGYDAAHCAKAVCSCSASGIRSISSVHDSFGCHAGSVSAMRSCLVNSLVDMYRGIDPLEMFRQDMLPIAYKAAAEAYLAKHPGKGLTDLPASLKEVQVIQGVPEVLKGDLNLEDVRQSVYIFS